MSWRTNKRILAHSPWETIPVSERNDFVTWTINHLWSIYKEYCMKSETILQTTIDNTSFLIPNGTVNKEYSAILNIPKTEEAEIQKVEITGLPKESGLSIERDPDGTKLHIKGSPLQASSYSLQLCYECTLPNQEKSISIKSKKFPLIINPDPRSLWKDLPYTGNLYPKENEAKDYKIVPAIDGKPQKDIVAASKRGRSHAHEGKPRDDDFSIEYLESGWYILSVADGAGSAKYSREGSRIACETVKKHCSEKLSSSNTSVFEQHIIEYQNNELPEKRQTLSKPVGDDLYHIVGEAAFKAQKAIEEEAKANQTISKDYATTLLLVICKKFDFGWFIASFWVGDGAICIYNKDKKYAKLLGIPDGGEYAGQTRFLTMPEIFSNPTALYQRLRFSIEEDFTALFLMSDGVSDPFFETDANLNNPQKWDEFWENLSKEVNLIDDNEESKVQLLKWLDFWSAGNHDDRTIVILY